MADINDILNTAISENAPSTSNVRGDAGSETHTVFVWVFVVFGLVACVFGIQNLYDDSYSRRVVGGDAYNFIVYSTRGTAWVCVGIVLELVAVVLALYATRRR